MLQKCADLLSGLLAAFRLNIRMVAAKITGKKTVAFYFDSAGQIMHLESVIARMATHPKDHRCQLSILQHPKEMQACHERLKALDLDVPAYSRFSSRFLLFCDAMISVGQSAGYPWFNCKHRICTFHGQPSKGNVYQRLNHARINGLFFYGPMMRDYFLKTKRERPRWPDIPWYETGQPKSDVLLKAMPDRDEARRQLRLAPGRFTVLYAPSFEYCSSLATHGREIIESLLSKEINLIVKPHPAFYSRTRMDDGFNEEIPKAGDWSERIRRYDALPHCLFREDNSLDPSLAIAASDVVLTDYSGITFDGILLDRGMVYWDCPMFFDEYLPKRYGVDGNCAKTELAANVGRRAGIVVSRIRELNDALDAYRRNPELLAEQRTEVRTQLLFNPGRATLAMVNQLQQLLKA